jgi:hypothetical protein
MKGSLAGIGLRTCTSDMVEMNKIDVKILLSYKFNSSPKLLVVSQHVDLLHLSVTQVRFV